MGDPINFVFGSRVGFLGTADRMALLPVGSRPRWHYFQFDQIQDGGWRPFWKFQMAISRQRVIRSTSCLILWWGSWVWRIEWRYFRSAHVQDGGWRPTAILDQFKMVIYVQRFN